MKRLLVIALLTALALTGCTQQADTGTVFRMDTVMSLSVWGGEEDTLTRLDELLADLEETWSVTEEGSALSRLNRGEDCLTDEQQAFLARVEALSERTGGAFDPHLHALSQCWGFYDEEYRVPTQEEIAQALTEDEWDLGAVLKGYAGQACAQILEEDGADRGLLSLGGNIQTYGTKPGGESWQIGIQDPDGGDPVALISVQGTMAAVTSGDYQRYFEVDGVRYHHILDPKTGYPADSGLRSVTVLCADGMTADALSTALFVLGLEDGAALWRESDDFEAVFLTAEGKLYATEGVTLTGSDYEVICR